MLSVKFPIEQYIHIHVHFIDHALNKTKKAL